MYVHAAKQPQARSRKGASVPQSAPPLMDIEADFPVR